MVFTQSRPSCQQTQQSVFIKDKNYALQSRCKSVLRVTADFSPKTPPPLEAKGVDQRGQNFSDVSFTLTTTSSNFFVEIVGPARFWTRNIIYRMTQLAFRTKISSPPDGICYENEPKELFQTAHVPPLYVLSHSKNLFGLYLSKYMEIHRILARIMTA